MLVLKETGVRRKVMVSDDERKGGLGCVMSNAGDKEEDDYGVMVVLGDVGEKKKGWWMSADDGGSVKEESGSDG